MFGGKREGSGGRESRTAGRKACMRQSADTVNYSGDLPLARGVKPDECKVAGGSWRMGTI